MDHRKLSDAERWQAVGMVRGGMSYIKTAERLNVSHSVIEAAREPNRECKRTEKGQESL